ncbi:bacitracin resistance protein BacA [Helicobacter cholecystus]|uniref:Bacitracin resistance protein BacA n=1 Tax=Helicobacter cholecystus TaxID=45498 RepID=A0A3D8IW62_9HELI|nr:globin domain-containing protein [Helicobacter cholecystus]RDU69263.1 bacitracin resistance protein BacA [Helicobacter cholecystus]VEJ24341.1 Soluble cytochrome O [Helicobacter cholecystus]
MLDQKTIEIVKSTAPILRERGEEITKEFYRDMFERYPEVKSMFDMNKQKDGSQPKALANAVWNAAINIDNMENMRAFVSKIGVTHVKSQVKPEHYPIVGECLLKAVKTVLNVDDEVINAWEKAYDELAKFYIQIEEELYQKA